MYANTYFLRFVDEMPKPATQKVISLSKFYRIGNEANLICFLL